MTTTLRIREIDAGGFVRVWPIFRGVIASADTCGYAPDLDMEPARALNAAAVRLWQRHGLRIVGRAHHATLSAL